MKLDCPSCGAAKAFDANPKTVMDLFYCPECDLCHVVQFEDGVYWMERMDEPDLEPPDEGFSDLEPGSFEEEFDENGWIGA
jgi:hypothetical protein